MSHRRLKHAVAALAATLIASVATPAYADWALNMPEGASDISREIFGLHMLILWICVVIGVVVFGAMIWSIIAHRKSVHPEAATFHHNTKVEIVWTTIPFLILIGMAIPSAETLIKIEDTRDSALTVKVTGYQWKWHYDYLDQDVAFFSNLHPEHNAIRLEGSGLDPRSVDNYLREVDRRMVVPAGKKIRVLLTANDVIHSWWVPDLGGKKDAIPGYVNEWWFQADEPGVYRGVCAELCGRDHGFMPVVVEALPEADYTAWLEQMQGGTPSGSAAADAGGSETAAADEDREYSMDELMEIGERSYATNCASCHQLDGTGLGPFPALKDGPITTEDLPAHIDMVLNGSSQNPAMAAFGPQLSDLDIAAIITYERNAWGNDTGDVVQPSDIKAAR